jgi:PAS domain S-box-containing protein
MKNKLSFDGPDEIIEAGRLLSALDIGLTVVDRDMRLVWANDVATSLADDVVVGGHHCFAALWKRRHRCPDCLSLLVFRTGEPQEGIRERGRPSAPSELYRVRSIPVHDASGEVRWVAESLVRLPQFGTLHPPPELRPRPSTNAIVVIDRKERIVSWSPAAENILGFSVEEALGRRIDLIVPEDWIAEERTIAERTLLEGLVERLETTRRAKDGRRVPVALTTEVVRDESGEPIGRLCIMEDLSAVEQLRRRLVEQDRLLSHITHDVDDAIIAVDSCRKVKTWNRGAERLFGKSTDEVLDEPLAGVVADATVTTYIERVRGGTARRSERMRWLDARGDAVEVDVSGTVLCGPTGEPEGVALVARDVSERLRLDRQIVRSEKMAVVGSLAAGLAHEIGTPLNVISATAELLMLDVPGAHQRMELEGIVAETDRISRLVKDLLSFARGERSGLVPVDVSESVHRVLSLLHIPIDKKGVSVQVELAPNLPAVQMEPDGMHQLLLNLLLNAVAAVAAGGRVVVSARSGNDGAVVIQVHDDGPGVAPALRERVFDPFFTTRPDGTGLGLAVCARVVSDHGGDIRVLPGPLGGACFEVVLPVHQQGPA